LEQVCDSWIPDRGVRNADVRKCDGVRAHSEHDTLCPTLYSSLPHFHITFFCYLCVTTVSLRSCHVR